MNIKFHTKPLLYKMVKTSFILLLVIILCIPSELLSNEYRNNIRTNEISLVSFSNTDSEVDYFIQLITGTESEIGVSLNYISRNWKRSFIPMFIEIIFLNRNYETNAKFISLLSTKTNKNFEYDIHGWYKWMWKQDIEPHADYALFKSSLHKLTDPKFEFYFDNKYTSKIDLYEIMWGGVLQDGIPPLRKPNMILANEADYLDDSNIVFGIEVNGDARAYPKRILAWHEMFVDSVGDKSVTGVYCTLCGSMILYNNVANDMEYNLGTSGFLYRSNKLMYDKATQSLWNTLWGEPVVGPLTDKGIELERLSVVTSTWGEWKRRHPDTQVLSLNTGYRRNYDEGFAYKEYFSTDNLMFSVKETDLRLKNKAEILGLVFPHAPGKALAVSSKFLRKKTLYDTKVKDLKMIIITDLSGAHRVYESKGLKFVNWDSQETLEDQNGIKWRLKEAFLMSEQGEKLHRLPSHNAFWFGWYSAYPHTKLIK